MAFLYKGEIMTSIITWGLFLAFTGFIGWAMFAD